MSYTYGATAQTCNRLMPHAVTSTSDGKSYAYDCNGNMTADGDRTLYWDADNKPVAITRAGTTTTFAYSGDGARVKKVGLNGTTRYVGGYEDHVADTVKVKHISAGGLHVATRVTGGTNAGTYYSHGDHLGSLNVLTNSSGAEVQRLTYLPFGETFSNTGSLDFEQHRYTGQEQDPETGLYFYQARYYNPVLGRFISPDSMVPGAGNPQSLNRYSYVTNNPVNLVDPSGHFSLRSLGNILNTIANLGRSLSIWMVGSAVGSGLSSALAGTGGVVSGAIGGSASGAFVGMANGQSPALGAVTGGLSGGVAGFFGNSYSLSRVAAEGIVGGVNARIRGGSFAEGMGYSALLSGVTYGNYLMRQEAIANSRLNPDNINGVSEGMFGDGRRVGGSRWEQVGKDEWICESNAGGCQGLPYRDGKLVGEFPHLGGLRYYPGDPLDKMVESFGGPHDFFRNLTGAYDEMGNAIHFTGLLGNVQNYGLNYGLLIPAAPFAAAGLVPPSMYDALRVSRPW